jgi:hypothetical protein
MADVEARTVAIPPKRRASGLAPPAEPGSQQNQEQKNEVEEAEGLVFVEAEHGE